MARRRIVCLLVAVVALAGCAPSATVTPNPLAGGVLATFDVQGQCFRVWVTNPETIRQVLELQAGKSRATIPNGRILRGAGQANHNAPWSWHLDPQDLEMAEITIELCDGSLTFVEENLAEFVDNVGRYCPWGAELVGVEDYR